MQASSASQLAAYVTDPAIMRDAEALLAGRTRDIKLTGTIGQAFRDRSWRQTAKIIRAWMAWVIVLDLLSLTINAFLLEPAVAVSMLAPGATIPMTASAIYLIWKKRHSDRLLGWTLNIGMFAILLAVCLMGAAAGGQWHERYLYIMVFVAIAGITTFNIPMQHTWAIAASALGLYLVFQLGNPLVGAREVFSSFFFLSSGVTAVVVARQTMTVLAQKAFLLELRDGARLLTLSQANERLDRLSRVDPLTGLANRRWMSELLAELARRPVPRRGATAILMCDIDRFKMLNDRLGHAEGDRCLARVAEIIDSCVRSGSDHVARYGGEEFLVILPDTSREEALAVAEGIRRAVAQAALPNPGSRPGRIVTISIGVAARGADQAWTPDELQSEADLALYQAKQEGRNRVRLFSPKAAPPLQSQAGAA